MLSENKILILSTLEDIKYSIELIFKRFEGIKSDDDFFKDDEGLQKLDSISMRLVAIGEGFKNVDKLSKKQLLKQYPEVPWQQVKGIRDVLSHHYFNIDAEIIYEICKHELKILLETTTKMIDDLNKKEEV